MRTIKFRGLRTDGKGWAYGSLLQSEIDVNEIAVECAIVGRFANSYDIGKLEVIPESVSQFTGLHDKNGKEIYEGDILDSSEKIPMIFEVYYQDGGFRYGTKDRTVDISFSGHNWLENILKRFHVIGSIHTTPDLLND